MCQLQDPNRVRFPSEDLVHCQLLRLAFHYKIVAWYKSMEDLLALRVCHRDLCDSPLINIEPVRAMFTALQDELQYENLRYLAQIRECDEDYDGSDTTDSDEE